MDTYRDVEDQARIEALEEAENLTEWEEDFVDSVCANEGDWPRLTDRQREIADRIISQKC